MNNRIEQDKIVSIEERIPKLKEQRKQKTNKRLVSFLCLFFILILLVIYFQSPLSKISAVEVSGSIHASKEEIIKKSGIAPGTGYWSLDGGDAEREIKELKEIKSVQVLKTFPNKVTLKVEEYKRVAYAERNGSYLPILENGFVLGQDSKSLPSDAPILINWKEAEHIQEMASALLEIPGPIAASISEIYHAPDKNDSWRIKLYMNEGYVISGSVRNIAEKIKDYPSIIAQLEPGSKGMIHMEVGTYFESFEQKKDTEEKLDQGEEADETER
ncbi:FtsQ-type POTRA domain-containing protein [Bacillus mangrovi]|uniref:Cell division protein DivIB n=1 Tax=Metabacillus mangrovi TaxID=1491830 RepID=A0A7X2S344_9BACI|nr:cell division protein FtsQ/DivIB [Metabacillus mangrovi]MTH52640.1 FtsQ-type POTRA domain-containing protein [Metabacillus mangrovi]